MFQPFDIAVKNEAAHQVDKWGTVHDRKKEPQEWYWLVGYRTKALHHTISSAAVLFHWHSHITDNVENDGPSDLEQTVEQTLTD